MKGQVGYSSSKHLVKAVMTMILLTGLAESKLIGILKVLMGLMQFMTAMVVEVLRTVMRCLPLQRRLDCLSYLAI